MAINCLMFTKQYPKVDYEIFIGRDAQGKKSLVLFLLLISNGGLSLSHCDLNEKNIRPRSIFVAWNIQKLKTWYETVNHTHSPRLISNLKSFFLVSLIHPFLHLNISPVKSNVICQLYILLPSSLLLLWIVNFRWQFPLRLYQGFHWQALWRRDRRVPVKSLSKQWHLHG